MKKTFLKKASILLSNLKFAIFLLLLIALFSALGTIIEQNKSLEFYKLTYSEKNLILNWKLIIALQLNNIFQAWWYLGLLFTLGCSLTICSLRIQYPMLKIARKYLFYTSVKQFQVNSTVKRIPNNSFNYILRYLFSKQYCIFYKKNAVYAHQGLSRKIAPLFIHLSILLVLIGISISSCRGYIAQEMIVKGEIFHIQNISNLGSLSYLPQNIIGRVNNFWITYDTDGNIQQFFSDLSILDNNYQERYQQTISVNHPLKYHDLTIYQTDWNLVGMRLLLDDRFIVQIPLQKIQNANNELLWSSSLENENQLLISFVVQSLQSENNIFIYDNNGNLIRVTNLQSSFEYQQHTIKILDIMSSTGLQIKQDAGLPFVYQGFLWLMIAVIINSFSYKQIWLLQDKNFLYITNKDSKDSVLSKNQLILLLKEFHKKRFLLL